MQYNLFVINFSRKMRAPLRTFWSNVNHGQKRLRSTDLKGTTILQHYQQKYEDDFLKFKIKNLSPLSWTDSIGNAKKLSNYDLNLVERIIEDSTLNNIMDYKGLGNSASFQELVRHFLRTYNFQLTGLVTIIFTKLFLVSTQYWPVDIIGKPKTLIQAENDIKKMAECYDMISYGFYFHDLVESETDSSSKRSLRNLLVLIGDYFLVKSNYDIASFKQIELYKIYARSLQKISEGESLALSCSNNIGNSLVPKTQIDSKSLTTDHKLPSHCLERSNKLSAKESETIINLIDYCYLTGGQVFASSLQSAFKLADFSLKSQTLAFEFGKNFGIAIKMCNQLSAVCLHQKSPTKLDLSAIEPFLDQTLPTYHLNLSYFAKFPTVPVEIMQDLVSEYVNRSRKLLISFCDSCPSDSNEKYSQIPLSSQATLFLQTLRSILNEIQDFNHQNVQQYLNNK